MHFVVNVAELPAPVGRIEELAVIEAVVVGRVGLGEVGGRNGGHLVSVDRVADEEVLALVGYLTRREATRPRLEQAAEHRVRSAVVLLAQLAVDGQLVVGHAHLDLVELLVLALFAERHELGRGRRVVDGAQRRQLERLRAVEHKRAQVGLADAADRVEVGTRAVVLGEVAAQALVHVGRAEHEQRARPTDRPQSELSEEVGDDHAQARLDVLQRGVLDVRAAVDLELGHDAHRRRPDGQQRLHGHDDHARQVVGADLRGQRLGAALGRLRAVACAHVAGDEQLRAQLVRRRRRIVRIAHHSPQIAQHFLIFFNFIILIKFQSQKQTISYFQYIVTFVSHLHVDEPAH